MALVFYHVYMRMRTTLLFRNGCVGELISCFRKSCFSQGRTWSSVVNVYSLSFTTFFFFLSFLHFLSDPISFSVFFLSFFLSFPQQTETTEIKENSSTKWGWLQGTPDYEPRLADAPISRPLLSSATDNCSALKFRRRDSQVFKTHIDFFFKNI